MKNRFCLILAAIASLSIANATQAQIAVDGTTATQVNGNAIAPTGAGTVNGDNLYHSFSEFNVQQTGVIFNTGNSAVNGADVRNIINRVTGDNPSAILGTIESRQAFPNANLYLMNPNGIVFGQNARLDIGGSFHATTGTGLGFDNGTFNVDKNSLSFPSGDPKTIRFAVSQPAGLINQGNLAVDTGKTITFTGGSIINTGTLTAPSGNIALTSVAGNSQVELRSPDVVLGLQVTNNAIPANWNGKITELPKLAELLTGQIPEANQVVVKADGSLALVSSPAPTDVAVTNGMAIVSGRVDVSSPDSKAGNVGIFGEKVGLVNAQIDASGVLGGGTVLIGGNLQGIGIAPNAFRTFVDRNSKIDVSALLNGDGGTAIVWADQTTRFLGSILAKGGTLSGDGGFVEVSGKQNLDYRGNVNTLAPNGKTGTLLLDPTDINIVNTTGTFFNLTEVDEFSDPDIGTNEIEVGLLSFAGTNITLQATNNINFNTAVTIFTAGVGLTAQAGNNINLNQDLTTTGGNINLLANNGSTATGTGSIQAAAGVTIVTNGGDFNATGFNFSNVSLIDTSSTTGGGNIDINVTGSIDASSSSLLTGVEAPGTGNGGNITLRALGNIQASALQAADGVGATVINGGNVTLDAGGNIAIGTLGSISTRSTAGGRGGNILLNSGGTISVLGTTGINASVSGASASAQAGNVTFNAVGNIITDANITTGINTNNTSGNAGNIIFTSGNNISATGFLLSANLGVGRGGNITVQAITSITTGDLYSASVNGIAGNVLLDPIGDITVNGTILASGLIQGGNVSIATTGGNIRINSTIPANVFGFPTAGCAGASICTASSGGGTGGSIFIRHGGLTPFTIGNASINGTAGFLTTGTSTLEIGRIIPLGNSIFAQGNISIAPSGETTFTPPNILVGVNPVDIETQALLEIKDVMKREVDRFLKEENLEKAFQAIENAYVSELGIFLGESLTPPALSISEAQDILSDVSKRSGSASVLIYPIMLNDRLEILVIPPKELGKPFHRYTNYANEEEIITVLTDYRASLRDTSSLDYLEQAQKLYDWVMRPIDAQLQALKIETVVFVMDSGLRVIPPAALHDGKQFLVERYASANIPALRVTRLEERDRQNTRVLAMGLTEAREGLSALPAVEVEIKTIGTQVLAGTTFLDRDFTVANLQAQRGKAKYGILHLGTHGQFLEDRAKDSYIQFWDGKLRSHQIPSLRFDQPVIDMLTLSACETAVGNNLGISGLAVDSGARSILASLWAVSDVGTAPLMISFYKAFPNALSKATALRQAQLDLLKGKVKIENNQILGIDGLAAIALPKGTENVDIKHPFFWSSFILVGNWL
ncbi:MULTISPECIES: CHAT domain-containing protein [Pseudanabaena]|jgi:filamentous hemagglutinin family protein|uniref:CHAT domain-containing protein n=1 Tax=Pseudanabaena TaxID=1152 RepID=UPI002479CDCA|nr:MULTISPECIES: CHAT domain-containing protein [Pseudanabaena]MEA5487420.1 CHAT domain-containing protein [Pseudanabaena sp. CCNP1317]WGS73148.1 CHAT domain-containing protein [Pseudanabaena galeata CCNP1313]